jgi:hypothetical protein
VRFTRSRNRPSSVTAASAGIKWVASAMVSFLRDA